MAKAILRTTTNRANKEISKLEAYTLSVVGMEAKYQFLIGEVVMLRLFAILENTLAEIASKLCCSADYNSGKKPVINVKSKSVVDAEFKMRSYNRSIKKQLRYLKWTSRDEIFNNLKFVMDSKDPFLINLDYHKAIFNEMRHVRNHIAHISSSTKKEYKKVIKSTYGVDLNMSAGTFLMSTKKRPRNNISRYIVSIKVIINDVTKG